MCTVQYRTSGPRNNQMLVELGADGSFQLQSYGAAMHIALDVVAGSRRPPPTARGRVPPGRPDEDLRQPPVSPVPEGAVEHAVDRRRRPPHRAAGRERADPIGERAAIVGTLTASDVTQNTNFTAYPAYRGTAGHDRVHGDGEHLRVNGPERLSALPIG